MANIIVTINDSKETFTIDMQIPTNLACEQLLVDIRETLKGYSEGLITEDIKQKIYSNRLKRELEDTETPEQAGIWNGDILTLVDVEEIS